MLKKYKSCCLWDSLCCFIQLLVLKTFIPSLSSTFDKILDTAAQVHRTLWSLYWTLYWGEGRRLIVPNRAVTRWLKTFILMQACHLTVCSNLDLSGPYSAVIILVLLRSQRTQSFQGIATDCTQVLQIEAGLWLPASLSGDPRANAFSPVTQVFWYWHTSALALFISDTPADLQPLAALEPLGHCKC